MVFGSPCGFGQRHDRRESVCLRTGCETDLLRMNDGALIIDKPRGLTSFDVVRQVRRWIQVRRVGHTGTLDPLATGVLVVCVGRATRLVEFIQATQKVYQTTLRLGIETDTLDVEGTVCRVSAKPLPTAERIIEVCRAQVGYQWQTPPDYSAIKIDGQRSYHRARQGLAIDLQPRQVHIIDLAVQSIDRADVTISVTCSAGTYIRSLVAEIGSRLGVGAHVIELRRLKNGDYDTAQAVPLEELVARSPNCAGMIPVCDLLPSYPEICVTSDAVERVKKGDVESLKAGLGLEVMGRFKCVTADRQLVAIGERSQGAAIRWLRVFT